MNSEPMVSVIIPFYKRADWLIEAIDSVYAGTYTNFEIILVNDGSDEDIDRILERYDDRLKYLKQQNSGPAIARNNGIKEADGKYIAFLDSDDYWEKEKLERQVMLMESQGCAWSHTAYTNFWDGTEVHTKIDVSHIQGNIFPWCIYSSKIATPCVMVRAKILKEDGLQFEEDMRHGQDVILWFKLASLYEIGFVDFCLVHVRKTGTNVSQNVKFQLLARAQLWNKIKAFDKESFKKIKGIGKISYKWCSVFGSLIKKLSNRTPDRILKFLSALFYLPAYAGFKIAARKK